MSDSTRALCRIVGLALPLTISQFFTFALGLIALLFVGRLGEQELAIAVLATSFMNVTGGAWGIAVLGTGRVVWAGRVRTKAFVGRQGGAEAGTALLAANAAAAISRPAGWKKLRPSADRRSPCAPPCAPAAGFSLVMGLLGALDTLCGQAWGEHPDCTWPCTA